MKTVRILLAASVALVAAAPALAQSVGSAQRPAAAKSSTRVEAFRASGGDETVVRIGLQAPDAAAITALKQSNSVARHKRLDIGIGRELDAFATAPQWRPVAEGRVATWEVSSREASAVRVALMLRGASPGVEVRFAGNQEPGRVYGPFSPAQMQAAGYWSPVLEGDTARIEVFVPGTSPEPAVAPEMLSHLFASPSDPRVESVAKAAGLCEVNFVCRAAGDAVLTQTGSSVARMTFTNANGGTSFCTGTLLNPGDGSFAPYFFTAAHCIQGPSGAKSLTTHWFYESATCNVNAVGPSYVQVAGGGALLYASRGTDASFLRLNNNPPASAFYSGWDAATVSPASPIIGIHHPDGDVKKISLGSIAGFDTSPLSFASGSYTRVQWNAVATGVTEGGSSGSGIWTGNSGAGYRFRGGLLGGASSCEASTAELFDHYSRLDLVYPYIAQFLNPSNAPAVGANALANPGFESGTASWTQVASSGAAIITTDAAVARTGSVYAWLGGAANATDTIFQTVTIPAGTARLRFWHRVDSSEVTATRQFDVLTVSLVNANGSATLVDLGTLNNLDAASGWVQSPVYDLSDYAGQTVRLQLRAVNDFSNPTSFRIDDLTLNGTTVSSANNATALWWNSNESGWGMNVNQQGDTAFATLFTYDAVGAPLWLVMPAGTRKGAAETFTGEIYRTTGSPFNTNPFPPIGSGNITSVGTMTLDFNAGGKLGYTVNDTYVSKVITKQVYGAAAANCQPTTASRIGATNYQDLWWNPSESGWGINLTHQGNTIFATLFTYGTNGQGLWLVLPSGARQQDGSFLGALYRTTGPVFNAQPWSPIGSVEVGTMRLTFQNGENATLVYTVNGVSVTKSITRQLFGSSFPLCTG